MLNRECDYGMELAPQPVENFEQVPLAEIIKKGGFFQFLEEAFPNQDILEKIQEEGLQSKEIITFIEKANSAKLSQTSQKIIEEVFSVRVKIKTIKKLSFAFNSLDRKANEKLNVEEDPILKNKKLIQILLRSLLFPEIASSLVDFCQSEENLSNKNSFVTLNNWTTQNDTESMARTPYLFAKKWRMRISDIFPYIFPNTNKTTKEDKYQDFFKNPEPQKSTQGQIILPKKLSAETTWKILQNLVDTQISFKKSKAINTFFENNSTQFPLLSHYLSRHDTVQILDQETENELITELNKFKEEFLAKLQKNHNPFY